MCEIGELVVHAVFATPPHKIKRTRHREGVWYVINSFQNLQHTLAFSAGGGFGLDNDTLLEKPCEGFL